MNLLLPSLLVSSSSVLARNPSGAFVLSLLRRGKLTSSSTRTLFSLTPLLLPIRSMTSSTSDTTEDTNARHVRSALFSNDELWDPTWQEAQGEKTLKKRMQKLSAAPNFTLYSSWFCPFAQRAWIAAEESDVDYYWIEIDPYQVNQSNPGGYTKIAKSLDEKRRDFPGFVEASPRGLVPALQASNDIVLWESLPVAEYIDAVYGGGKLVNRQDPYDVARQQIWCAHCTDRIQKKYYQALVTQDKETEQECVDQFYKECRALAQAMKDDGPYFDGAKFTLVDVALAPFWQRILTVGPAYFGLTLPIDEPDFQRLDKWWKAASTRPSVAATIVCEPRLVSTYSDYSKDIATSDAARNYFK